MRWQEKDKAAMTAFLAFLVQVRARAHVQKCIFANPDLGNQGAYQYIRPGL